MTDRSITDWLYSSLSEIERQYGPVIIRGFTMDYDMSRALFCVEYHCLLYPADRESIGRIESRSDLSSVIMVEQRYEVFEQTLVAEYSIRFYITPVSLANWRSTGRPPSVFITENGGENSWVSRVIPSTENSFPSLEEEFFSRPSDSVVAPL